MNYTVKRRIGAGSFGIVHEIRDEKGAVYAAKSVERDDPAAIRLLGCQYRLLSSLDHARIAKAVDFDVVPSLGPALITEFVDGMDIRSYVEEKGESDLFEIALRVLDALRYLHGTGTIHGDLKPDSILVTDGRGSPEVKLVDVGLGLERDSEVSMDAPSGPGSSAGSTDWGGKTAARAGTPRIAGTLPYMAPEIIRNAGSDGRSDLYSLGAVLYEVLTGVRPFEGRSAPEILRRHLEHEPPPPSEVRRGIPKMWDAFVAGLLGKEPILRYPDATVAALDLCRLFDRPGAFAEVALAPRSLGSTGLGREIAGIRRFLVSLLAPDATRALAIAGNAEGGVEELLRLAAVNARAAGMKAYPVRLEAGRAILAQIIDVLASSGLRRDPPADPAAALADIMHALESSQPEASGPKARQIEAGKLLVIDAGEAGDLEELAALGRIVRKVGVRSGVVVGYRSRSSGAEQGNDLRAFDRIEIPDFDEEGVEAAVKDHFGVKALPDDLAGRVWRATRGRRGLVDAVLGRLWRDGSVSYREGKYGLELAWDGTVRVPLAEAEALRQSLEGLSPGSCKIVALVCAAGGRLDVGACREALSADDWAARLEELAAEGLVATSEDGTGLVLGRMEAREALEPLLGSALLKAGVPAGWLEGAAARLAALMEARTADPYALGLLYLRGGRPADALRWLVAAADRAARYSTADAIAIYEKALGCAVSRSSAAEVRERMGDARLLRGDLNGALRDFEEASRDRPAAMRKVGWVHGLRADFDLAASILSGCERAARDAADLTERARVLSDLGYIYTMQGKREKALGSLKEAETYFEDAGMALEAGIASNRIGILEMRSGNVKQAARAWEAAKDAFERARARRHVGISLETLALSRRKEMDFARSLAYMEQALAVFKETRALAEEARCLQNYGMVLLDTGDLARARNLAREALDLNLLLGQFGGAAMARLLLAAIELEAGSAGEVERIVKEIPKDGRKMTAFEEAVATRYLAGAAAIRGRREEALALADQSYGLAREAGDSEGEQQAILEKSKILLRLGRHRQAAELAQSAFAALSASSGGLDAAVAEGTAGEALCLAGETEKGMERLLAAKASLQAIPESVHMARVMRALAAVCGRTGDWNSFGIYYRLAADLARKCGARYDFALALLEAGRAAGNRGAFIRARHYLAEAGRIFGALGAEDLHNQAVVDMERVGPDESEISAVTSLSRISQTLNSSFDLSTVLNLAMDLAMEYLGAERGVLMLEDGTKGRPATVVERKMDPESVEEAITISRSIVEVVRRTREPVIASDATTDPRFMNSKSVRIHNVMSVMCVPLMRGEHLLGTIYLDNRDVPSEFSALEKAFVAAFANQVALAIENARDVGKLYEDVSDLKAVAGKKYSFANIIGPGKEMQEVFRHVEKAAKSSIAVLLTGESGTGKELIAGLLHELGPRRGRPMVKVNCAAIHRDLLETELFGIEKAVATGIAPRSGFFERADGGTVFLDEIGDMPPTIQTKVLRVLAEKEFERVGGSKPIKVDVRVISATNQDLKSLIKGGAFRNDLYYRLNGMRIHLPSLRERMDDLPVLVTHFVSKYAAENRRPPMRVSRDAWEVMKKYGWPGNVRELEKCIEHAVVVADGVEIEARHIPSEILEAVASPQAAAASAASVGLPQALKQTERDSIVKALRETGGIKTAAARKLGIHESTLRKKMKAHGLRSEGGN